METFFFAIPLRLVWDNFQRFMGERPNPDDSIDFLVPTTALPPTGYAEDSLGDYFGIPTGIPGLEVSALPFRAYWLVWNEWFRDQNLQDRAAITTDDGPDGVYGGLAVRGKRHDYFTSCLPWPQKGDAVDIPIGQSAPVIPDSLGASPNFKTAADPTPRAMQAFVEADGSNEVSLEGAGITPSAFVQWNEPHLQVDLSSATSATINQLRQAFQVQRLLERDARGGTRYTEIVRAHFGVARREVTKARVFGRWKLHGQHFACCADVRDGFGAGDGIYADAAGKFERYWYGKFARPWFYEEFHGAFHCNRNGSRPRRFDLPAGFKSDVEPADAVRFLLASAVAHWRASRVE